MAKRGKFFVIEGTDASGKKTQFEILAKRLRENGYDVVTFDFPRYNHESSYFVRQYLAGEYGGLKDVGPYTSSLFYALDRYAAGQEIEHALSQGKVVLANRFTGSNMAHQGSKFINPQERKGYFIWLDNLEFETLRIPRPDMSFVLRVEPEIIKLLLDKRSAQDPEHATDIHESDLNHIKRAVTVYDDMCALFPKDFVRIDCVRSNRLMKIEHIQEILWNMLERELPAPPPVQQKQARDTQTNYLEKTTQGRYQTTAAGEAFLDTAVTNTEDSVYAFKHSMNPVTVAAAMARLSRRSDDMRITLLDEFTDPAKQSDQKLLQKVISAYGDDSVQQLVGQHVVVEGASNLLTKKLEWGRLSAYLEQSTRYIYFDQKDTTGNYKYVTPRTLDLATSKVYTQTMDQIFDLYSDMVHALTNYVRNNSNVSKAEQDGAWKAATRAQACDAVRSVLPVATQSTVGIYASAQALENMIMNLQADTLDEARETGKKVLRECRKTIGTFLERADKPDRGGATIAYRSETKARLKHLADDMLPATHVPAPNSVDLISVWPRNELDLVADMLYEHSNMSLREIQTAVSTWTYEEKEKVYSAYMGERLNRRHRPGRALEKAHYSWDIVCDYGIFRDLQRHRMVDDLAWQDLTPRYGYEMPELVDEAGLVEQYEQCFELSLKLHGVLVGAGYETEAQYATLLGHKMRWKITYNARQAFHIHELRTSPQGHPGYRKIVNKMHEKLAEKHPLLASAMAFVNKKEDPSLTRLAAERASQSKAQNQ